MSRSDKSEEVLAQIQDFIEKNGYSPTVRDIMKSMGFNSTATVQYYFNKLEKMGKISKKNNINRSLSLKNQENLITANQQKFPLLGRVSAGLPIFAAENIEEYYSLPGNLFRGSNLFLLRVSGDSMIGAGIFNDDLIIVDSECSTKNGDIVVAYIDGDVTVKRLFYHNDHITLHAENPKYADMEFTDNVSVLGKVVGSIRQFNW